MGGDLATVALNTRAPAAADRALLWSVAGHVALLVLVLIGGISLSRTPPPSRLAIKATVVESPTNRRPRTAPAPRPEPKPEPKVEPKAEAPPPKPEPDPALAQRKAEQQKLAKEKAAVAVKRDKALRDKQRAEQAADKQRQEKAAAERQKAEADKQKAAKDKAEAERQRVAKEAEARERERQREELAEEERLLAAADSGALSDYVRMIGQKVERNWLRPPGARPGLECEVSVTQIPGGEVTAVQIGRCNADEAVRRSIEAAVLKASPLPLPDDATLFERNLRFTFKPEQ